MICDRCYQPTDQGEHGVYLCPLEPRQVQYVVRPDDIPGGLVIEHGLCNPDGTPRTYYSHSEITAECQRRGLTRWTDVYDSSKTKDAEVRADWMRSSEAKRAKADRDEMRRLGIRPQVTRSAPPVNRERREMITRMVRERLASQ